MQASLEAATCELMSKLACIRECSLVLANDGLEHALDVFFTLVSSIY
jgi:hypothetical protein